VVFTVAYKEAGRHIHLDLSRGGDVYGGGGGIRQHADHTGRLGLARVNTTVGRMMAVILGAYW